MADNNFINTFPSDGSNQAIPNGRNVTGSHGRRGNQRPPRSSNANAGSRGGRGGGGGGRGRRHFKQQGGGSGYTDLANAMKDEAARIKGEFDALREQVKFVNERAQKEENDERRLKSYVRNKLMKGLKKIDIEFKSEEKIYPRSNLFRFLELVVLIGFGYLWLFLLNLDVVDLVVLFCLAQLTVMMLAELSLELLSWNALLRCLWYKILVVICSLVCWGLIYIDPYMDSLMKYYLVICPIYFFLYSVILGFLSWFGRKCLVRLRSSIFGWFISCVSVSVTKWDNPKPLFFSIEPGVDLRPQSQRHIKLTDAEMKFRLDYRRVERLDFVLLCRITSLWHDYNQHSLEEKPDYCHELSHTNKVKTLEASFGLLCELSDYDVCGLETDHLIAKERIKNRLRTVRSVNIDKYSAQTDNIYSHTTLVALALWHQRRQELKDLPNFD